LQGFELSFSVDSPGKVLLVPEQGSCTKDIHHHQSFNCAPTARNSCSKGNCHVTHFLRLQLWDGCPPMFGWVLSL